jgi:hypothetical protein
MLLLGTGLIGLAGWRRRKFKKNVMQGRAENGIIILVI